MSREVFDAHSPLVSRATWTGIRRIVCGRQLQSPRRSLQLRFGFGQALSMMLWLAVIIYWIESRFLQLEGMQAPVLALAALCVPLPALFPGLASASAAHSTEFRLHLALAMIAYGLFTIAALHALLMTLMEPAPARRRAGRAARGDAAAAHHGAAAVSRDPRRVRVPHSHRGDRDRPSRKRCSAAQ